MDNFVILIFKNKYEERIDLAQYKDFFYIFA